MFSKATIKERRQYYREEWDPKDLPGFISKDIKKREFGFDHNGRGPNDRYKVFGGTESLRKFLRYKAPFAAYISVAFYNNPRRREDWLKAEYILLKNIHLIYSGRGYHIRIMDEEMMTAGSELRSEVLKYAAGAEVPKSQFMNSEVSSQSFNFEHFTIPVGYQKIFTDRVKFNIQHMVGNEKLDGINAKLMKDIIASRHHLENDNWGLFKKDIGPRRYKNLVEAMARVNLATIDAKVSIDLKRILRLPSSLHSKVSMKCMEVKNRESFDPFDKAVPKFVYERKGV